MQRLSSIKITWKSKTVFINEDENTTVNPLSTMKKRLHCKFALKIDNIFIGGSKISLQMRLQEVHFKLSESDAPKQRECRCSVQIFH